MSLQRWRKWRWAAWLGLLAVWLQGLAPPLAAAEAREWPGALELHALCTSHPLRLADERNSPDRPAPHKSHTGFCPICGAFAAAGGLVPPPVMVLPAPAGRANAFLIARGGDNPIASPTASYLSRAPPVAG